MKPLGLLFMCNKLCNKSSNKIPSYLTIRNGVYYFCYRFPISITSNKSKILRYSLRTKDLSIARERLADLMPIIKKAKHSKQTQQLLKTDDKIGSNFINHGERIEMEDSDLEIKRKQLEQYKILLDKTENYLELDVSENKFGSNSKIPNFFSDMRVQAENNKLLIDEMILILKEHAYKTPYQGLCEFVVSQYKIYFDKFGEEATKKYIKSHQEIGIVHYSLHKAVRENNLPELTVLSTMINSKYTRLLTELNQECKATQDVNLDTTNNNNLEKISFYIPEFLQWEEGGRSRTKEVQQTYSRDLNFLIHVIGDKPINKVAKEDIKEALSFKKCMPVMNKNPYRQWGVEETVQRIKEGYEVEDDEDLVSSKTVKETLKCYQSFFSSFLFKEKDLLEKSPTENVTLTYESESYAPYTDTQMVDIVNYCRENPSEKTMVILIGAYTGMRLSEICNLTKESIRHDEESGYNYIFIKKGKTPAACRIVPICNKLKSAGLLEHINSFKSEQKMFSKKIDLITNEIQKIREILHIPHENEFGQRRVFHSIRHSVITKVRSKQISDPVLQKVVGHQTVKSITDRYTHNFPVKDLTCVVDCLDW